MVEESSGEASEGEEIAGGFIVARGYAAEVFKSVEASFYAVAVFIEFFV